MIVGVLSLCEIKVCKLAVLWVMKAHQRKGPENEMFSVNTCIRALDLVNEFIVILAKQEEDWNISFVNKALLHHLKLEDVGVVQKNSRNEDFLISVHGDAITISGYIILRPPNHSGMLYLSSLLLYIYISCRS